MRFNIFNILMLMGAIQGIVFSFIVFFSKKYQTKSIFFLSALILCFSLNNLQYFLLDSKTISFEEFFGIFYVPFSTLSMVLYFLYVKFFLFPDEKLTRLNKLLFIPFFLFFGLTLFYKIALAFGGMTEGISHFFQNLIHIHEVFALLFSLFLLILIFRQIWNFEKIEKDPSPTKINWLKNTSYISAVITLLYGFCIYNDLKTGDGNSDLYYILWICQSLVIYWLGHIGIYKFGINEDRKNIRKISSEEKITMSNSSTNEHILSFQKFIIDEQNYLDADLTLDLVSEKLGLSKSYLSRLINSELKTSFTDFVNHLRIEEAKLIIQNPTSEKFTLIAIGLEAGFNSKSAFNNAFKKYTGLTPSEYKKKQNGQ